MSKIILHGQWEFWTKTEVSPQILSKRHVQVRAREGISNLRTKHYNSVKSTPTQHYNSVKV